MSVAYKNLLIYYFSGTGNAKRTAEWVVETATEMGINARMINIDRFVKPEIPELKGKTLIGFCAPTHGFNLPPNMLKYIWKFPRRKNTDVFIINTRAGMKLSKLFVPGLSGLAQFFPALVLLLKGYKIKGMQPMDLPSNWISIHPGLRQKVVVSMFERCERITKKFAGRILNGGSKYKAFLSLPFDLAVAPIAVGYYFVGRFGIAKTFVASNACTNCGLCEKQCPVNAIKTIKGRPYWTFNCESCMRCMNTCPERAIETAQTFTIAFWWIILSLVTPWLLKEFYGIRLFNFDQPDWKSYIFENAFGIAVWFLTLWAGYHFIHFLMTFKAFNNLVAYTSFTKYKFWRRYKAPKRKKQTADPR